MAKVRTGYPRFVVHPFAAEACDWFEEASDLRNRAIFALNSNRSIEELRLFLGSGDFEADDREGVTFAHLPDSEDARVRGKLFLQHAGCGASSRRAEDLLVRVGRLDRPHEEEVVESDPDSTVREHLAGVFGEVGPEDVLLTSSGMNGFHALFQGIRETRRPLGRRIWVQLGWLYVDTILILQKFLGEDEELVVVHDVSDLEAIQRLLENRGREVAAVVTETPTNPLMQTCDLTALGELCEQSGALLIIDPTAASPRSVDVLPKCDVLVNSLTKYSGNEGDVMLGSLVFSPSSNAPDLAEIRERTEPLLEPPFVGDLHRLAWQIPHYEEVVRRSNASVMRLVSFLEERPEIRKVHWAYSKGFRTHYENIARDSESPGCMFSLELNLPLDSVYDALRLLKSPSFGCKFSLVCPYLYLAHYDLVSTDEGRAILRAGGLEPDLLRVSVGTEPVDDLIEVFAEALGRSARS
jgi:cystathionine gamma-synthase